MWTLFRKQVRKSHVCSLAVSEPIESSEIRPSVVFCWCRIEQLTYFVFILGFIFDLSPLFHCTPFYFSVNPDLS